VKKGFRFFEKLRIYCTLDAMQNFDYDLCVIGGGINGAGIARDAAGRGLSVLLVEAGDLASATSSISSKMIHGGLRYLENYEFKLVRESLKEREILLRLAPHLVRPQDFILPHDKTMRPYGLIRLGLFLYDMLGGRKKLKSSSAISLTGPLGENLKQGKFENGFMYSDCCVDDARLVILNAMSAAEKGAHILIRTACTGLTPAEDFWTVQMKDLESGEDREVKAGMVVNAAGPWVSGVIKASQLDGPDVPRIRLVKGSHIVIPKAFEGDYAYLLQQPDKRVVFVWPYEKNYTMIGTTDEPFTGDPVEATISEEEVNYLLRAFNDAFEKQLAPRDITWSFSGVRPLFDDGEENPSSVTRDFRFYTHMESKAPMISVFGGKLTTYRALAEQAVDLLLSRGGRSGHSWTASEFLPGGDIFEPDFVSFLERKQAQYDWLPEDLVYRYARSYGTRMDKFLEGARGPADLGRDFGEGIYEAEILYLVQKEWARTGEDVLWRRSKLGLHLSKRTINALESAIPEMARKMARAA
jgi:glycerol-3-phosphate dehydrogenase